MIRMSLSKQEMAKVDQLQARIDRDRSARAHEDGRKSVRHQMFGKNLTEVLGTIRKKGPDAGLKAAQAAGLAAHAEVRKAIGFAMNRWRAGMYSSSGHATT